MFELLVELLECPIDSSFALGAECQPARGATVIWRMWRGDPSINSFVDKWVAPRLESQYGITLQTVAGQGNELVDQLTVEKEAGASTGVASLMWINGETFAAMRASFTQAVDGLEAATRWLVDHYRQEPEAAAAVAVPYLKLFGTVAGGWLMARAALLARERLSVPGADRAFLEGKLATARFYLEHLLPQAGALAQTVTQGAASTLALDVAAF